MIFNLKKTAFWQLRRWSFLFKPAKLFCFFFLIFSLISVCFFYNSLEKGEPFLGVFFFLFWFFLELHLFYRFLKKPKLKHSLKEINDKFNLASFLSFDSFLILKKKKWVSHLINSSSKEVRMVFSRGQLKKPKAKQENIEKIVEGALETAEQRITPGDLLISLAEQSSFFKEHLIKEDFRKEDIENLVFWCRRIGKRKESKKKWWEKENLLNRGSLAKDFASSFTINLDKYCLDLREKVKKRGFREVVGHEKELKQIESILEKEEKNNVLLVGEPGVGRGSIIEELSQRIFCGKSSPNLNYKRVLIFDLSVLASKTTSQDEVEMELEKCFLESFEAGNVILVTEDFHNFLSENPSPGTINISGVLAKYLKLSQFRIIAITDYQGFHSVIERNSSLSGMFEKVEASEISERETLELLENLVPFFEAKHKRLIGYRALREIVNLSSRYLSIPFPEKSIRLLDESMAYLSTNTKDKVLEPRHIKRVVSQKTEIPLEDLEGKEKELLLNLEEKIHQRLIDQEEAVKSVSDALRRARAEVNLKSGPMGSFLFLGPTGVGKTELSKTLAEIYFGAETKMIRFDMSEFQHIDDIKRLIGTSKQEGLLTVKVREDPFSLILLDELEKAHKDILNLFLQVLDEGWLTDALGRKVDFKNTIIIATSNAGSALIQEDLKKGKTSEEIKEHLFDFLIKQGIYRPEFINRFDDVVYFKSLTKEDLMKIAHLMLKKLKTNLLDKGVKFEITLQLKEKIVELSYNPAFGAREMKRVIQDEVENVLAKELLSGKLKRGINVKVDPKNFNLLTW